MKTSQILPFIDKPRTALLGGPPKVFESDKAAARRDYAQGMQGLIELALGQLVSEMETVAALTQKAMDRFTECERQTKAVHVQAVRDQHEKARARNNAAGRNKGGLRATPAGSAVPSVHNSLPGSQAGSRPGTGGGRR